MDELNLQALLQDESFVNYCRRTEKEDIEKWEKWLQKYPEHQQSIAELKETILAMGYYAGEVSVQANYFRLQQQIKKHSNQNRFKEIGKTFWFSLSPTAALILKLPSWSVCSASCVLRFSTVTPSSGF